MNGNDLMRAIGSLAEKKSLPRILPERELRRELERQKAAALGKVQK